MLSTRTKVLIAAVTVVGVGYVATRKPKRKAPKEPGGIKPLVLVVPTPLDPVDPGAYTNYWTPEVEQRALEGLEYWMGEAKVEVDLEPQCPSLRIPDPGVWVWEEAALYVAQQLWQEGTWPPVQGVSPEWMVVVWGKIMYMARNMMCPNWKPIT